MVLCKLDKRFPHVGMMNDLSVYSFIEWIIDLFISMDYWENVCLLKCYQFAITKSDIFTDEVLHVAVWPEG